MATASPPAAAAAPSAPARRVPPRRLAALATVLGSALALRVVFSPSYLNYDARYALLWARDATRGLTPDYEAAFAPTPHPLETAASLLALPFGDEGDRLMLWLILVAFGVLVWLTFRLGETLFGFWPGVVAALVVLTRPALARDALIGYQDTAFAALIVGAVLLEAQSGAKPVASEARQGRGAPVLALLAVAGLMRPEAWVLGGLYWLYVARADGVRDAVRLAPLVVAAPVLWALMDWAVTGDPLHSLHGTSELAEAVDRRRTPQEAPYWTVQYYGYVLREPLVAGIPLGLFFAWRHRRHSALLPLAVVAAMTVVFMAGSLFGLPLIGRYVRTPSVLLAPFYGLAVAGFTLLPRTHPTRTHWMAAGAIAAALSLAWLPWHARMLDNLRDRITREGQAFADLEQAAEAPQTRAAFSACGSRITSGDRRPIPHLRYWLDADPGSVNTVHQGAGAMREVLLLRRDRSELVRAPAGYRRAYRNASWRVLAAPRCLTRPPA